jgi:tetratricopeptide (TPR) repeat protein
LRLWDSTQGLGEHPLARLPVVESGRRAAGYKEAAVGRGLALRDVLRRALDSLRPGSGEPDPADERWRHFVILSEQYVAGRKPDYVAEQLSFARSTYDHEQAAALDHLADVLRQWSEHPPAELRRIHPSGAAPFMAPPRRGQGLIGRADLLDDLRWRLINDPGDLALHGLPGVGKTALAVELAHDREVRAAFPEGVLWAGLGQRPDLAAQLALWGAALGIPLSEFAALPSIQDRARLVHTLLAQRRALLVVDDVWDPAEGLVFRLGGEGCARIYTCRSGAIATALGPGSTVRVPELEPDDGIDLLQRSIGGAGPIEDDGARRLVKAVGAHPLALVVMGRYLGGEGRDGQRRRREAALAGLERPETRLKIEEALSPLESQPSLPGAAPLTLEIVIGLSDDGLSEPAREALRRLAWFPPRPGTFGEELALGAGEGGEGTLHELVDSGLVEPAGDDRYSLHPVVSDFARGRSGAEARGSFAAGLLRLAVENRGDRNWLAMEADNLLTALEIAEAERLDEDVVRGILAVFPALEAEGRSAAALPHLERAEAIARQGEVETLVRVLAAKARSLQHLGNYSAAESAAGEALDLARRGNIGGPQPELMLLLGAAASSRGDADQAGERYEDGLKLAETARLPALIAAFEANLASLALKRGEAKEAESRLRLALRLAQAAGDRVREISVLINLGALLAQSKRLDEADAALQEAAELARLAGTREQRVYILTNLGALASDRGDRPGAEACFTEALRLARSMGDPAPIARLEANLAALATRGA